MVFNSLSAAHVSLSGLPNEALVRQQQLISYGVVPFSPSTLWRKVKAQEFPAPIKVSRHITAWRMSDVRAWATNPAAYRAPKVSNG